MGEMREGESGCDIPAKVQQYGVLSKKPFGHPSNKWAKRFFIIKDGFLLYYPDSERKDFEKRIYFNIHPKGIVPLGGCTVNAVHGEQGHPFSIHIVSQELNGNMVLAAESEYERDRWVSALKVACRVTWENVELGESIIQQLETQGLQMAKEKQDYFDKLQTEASALHDERQKTEELERIRLVLEEEKEQMERLANELRDEYSRIKGELDVTSQAMKSIEDDKHRLHSTTSGLQSQLESLQEERERVMSELQQWHSTTKRLSKEKQNLSEATETMKASLAEIEAKTQRLREEKALAEDRLLEKEEQALRLEEEKASISEHAQELKDSIKELNTQKAATEAELRGEVMARIEAERRLKDAEASLGRLEKAVNKDPETRSDQDEEAAREEMIGDVKTLKQFFENIAFESKLDADKTMLIKSSLSTRRTCVRRAQTLRHEANRKRRARSSGSFSPGSLSMSSNPMPLSTVSEMNLHDLSFSPPRSGIDFRHSTIGLNGIPESSDFV